MPNGLNQRHLARLNRLNRFSKSTRRLRRDGQRRLRLRQTRKAHAPETIQLHGSCASRGESRLFHVHIGPQVGLRHK